MRIKQGIVTVATAATRVRFTASATPFKWLKVQAVEGNTGVTYVGDVTVAAATGWTLYHGTDGVHSDITLDPGSYGGTLDLSDFYADAATNGDKVEYIAVIV